MDSSSQNTVKKVLPNQVPPDVQARIKDWNMEVTPEESLKLWGLINEVATDAVETERSRVRSELQLLIDGPFKAKI